MNFSLFEDVKSTTMTKSTGQVAMWCWFWYVAYMCDGWMSSTTCACMSDSRRASVFFFCCNATSANAPSLCAMVQSYQYTYQIYPCTASSSYVLANKKKIQFRISNTRNMRARTQIDMFQSCLANAQD